LKAKAAKQPYRRNAGSHKNIHHRSIVGASFAGDQVFKA
jgi:hypothetical protein